MILTVNQDKENIKMSVRVLSVSVTRECSIDEDKLLSRIANCTDHSSVIRKSRGRLIITETNCYYCLTCHSELQWLRNEGQKTLLFSFVFKKGHLCLRIKINISTITFYITLGQFWQSAAKDYIAWINSIAVCTYCSGYKSWAGGNRHDTRPLR